MVLHDFIRSPIVATVLAACCCWAILWVLLKSGVAWRLATDIPNDRSLHVRPTPRVGGWAIVPVVVVMMFFCAPELSGVALGIAFLGIVSQFDDRFGLPARIRFAAHLVAVVAFVVGSPGPAPWWILTALIFAMVWLVNLYNFMDGADGLAGGMTFFGFGAYAVAAINAPQPQPELAWSASVVSGAALGFLFLNFYPARIFLGDAGSISIGFAVGALGYWGWSSDAWPLWFPAMVFAPFIMDASVTLLRRLLRGEKFWQAHREHYYQRMVRAGVGHRRTALYWYAVMVVGIIIAECLIVSPRLIQVSGMAIWTLILALAGAAIDMRWRRFLSRGSRHQQGDADA